MTPMTRRAALVALGAAPAFAVAHRVQGAAALPKITVTKDPACGCCSGWTDHVRAAGFPVDVVKTDQLNRVKARLGVPSDLAACHTAEIDGYVIEGHVPASAIRRLLEERPRATGLAVPGMPVGSPGMEVEGTPPEPFEIIAFGPSGRTVFARFKGSEPL